MSDIVIFPDARVYTCLYLTQQHYLCCKLYSNSLKATNADGRDRVSSSANKVFVYEELVGIIFGQEFCATCVEAVDAKLKASKNQQKLGDEVAAMKDPKPSRKRKCEEGQYVRFCFLTGFPPIDLIFNRI